MSRLHWNDPRYAAGVGVGLLTGAFLAPERGGVAACVGVGITAVLYGAWQLAREAWTEVEQAGPYDRAGHEAESLPARHPTITGKEA